MFVSTTAAVAVYLTLACGGAAAPPIYISGTVPAPAGRLRPFLASLEIGDNAKLGVSFADLDPPVTLPLMPALAGQTVAGQAISFEVAHRGSWSRAAVPGSPESSLDNYFERIRSVNIDPSGLITLRDEAGNFISTANTVGVPVTSWDLFERSSPVQAARLQLVPLAVPADASLLRSQAFLAKVTRLPEAADAADFLLFDVVPENRGGTWTTIANVRGMPAAPGSVSAIFHPAAKFRLTSERVEIISGLGAAVSGVRTAESGSPSLEGDLVRCAADLVTCEEEVPQVAAFLETEPRNGAIWQLFQQLLERGPSGPVPLPRPSLENAYLGPRLIPQHTAAPPLSSDVRVISESKIHSIVEPLLSLNSVAPVAPLGNALPPLRVTNVALPPIQSRLSQVQGMGMGGEAAAPGATGSAPEAAAAAAAASDMSAAVPGPMTVVPGPGTPVPGPAATLIDLKEPAERALLSGQSELLERAAVVAGQATQRERFPRAVFTYGVAEGNGDTLVYNGIRVACGSSRGSSGLFGRFPGFPGLTAADPCAAVTVYLMPAESGVLRFSVREASALAAPGAETAGAEFLCVVSRPVAGQKAAPPVPVTLEATPLTGHDDLLPVHADLLTTLAEPAAATGGETLPPGSLSAMAAIGPPPTPATPPLRRLDAPLTFAQMVADILCNPFSVDESADVVGRPLPGKSPILVPPSPGRPVPGESTDLSSDFSSEGAAAALGLPARTITVATRRGDRVVLQLRNVPPLAVGALGGGGGGRRRLSGGASRAAEDVAGWAAEAAEAAAAAAASAAAGGEESSAVAAAAAATAAAPVPYVVTRISSPGSAIAEFPAGTSAPGLAIEFVAPGVMRAAVFRSSGELFRGGVLGSSLGVGASADAAPALLFDFAYNEANGEVRGVQGVSGGGGAVAGGGSDLLAALGAVLAAARRVVFDAAGGLAVVAPGAAVHCALADAAAVRGAWRAPPRPLAPGTPPRLTAAHQLLLGPPAPSAGAAGPQIVAVEPDGVPFHRLLRVSPVRLQLAAEGAAELRFLADGAGGGGAGGGGIKIASDPASGFAAAGSAAGDLAVFQRPSALREEGVLSLAIADFGGPIALGPGAAPGPAAGPGQLLLQYSGSSGEAYYALERPAGLPRGALLTLRRFACRRPGALLCDLLPRHLRGVRFVNERAVVLTFSEGVQLTFRAGAEVFYSGRALSAAALAEPAALLLPASGGAPLPRAAFGRAAPVSAAPPPRRFGPTKFDFSRFPPGPPLSLFPTLAPYPPRLPPLPESLVRLPPFEGGAAPGGPALDSRPPIVIAPLKAATAGGASGGGEAAAASGWGGNRSAGASNGFAAGGDASAGFAAGDASNGFADAGFAAGGVSNGFADAGFAAGGVSNGFAAAGFSSFGFPPLRRLSSSPSLSLSHLLSSVVKTFGSDSGLENLLDFDGGKSVVANLLTTEQGLKLLGSAITTDGALPALLNVLTATDGPSLVLTLADLPGGLDLLTVLVQNPAVLNALADLLNVPGLPNLVATLLSHPGAVPALLRLALAPDGLHLVLKLLANPGGVEFVTTLIHVPNVVGLLTDLLHRPGVTQVLQAAIDTDGAPAALVELLRAPNSLKLLFELLLAPGGPDVVAALVRAPVSLRLVAALLELPVVSTLLEEVIDTPGNVAALVQILRAPGILDLLVRALASSEGRDLAVRMLTTPGTLRLVVYLLTTEGGVNFLGQVLVASGGPTALVALLSADNGPDLLLQVVRTPKGPAVVLRLLQSLEGARILLAVAGTKGGPTVLVQLLNTPGGADLILDVVSAPLGPTLLVDLLSSVWGTELVLEIVQAPGGPSLLTSVLHAPGGGEFLLRLMHTPEGPAVLRTVLQNPLGADYLIRYLATDGGPAVLLTLLNTAGGAELVLGVLSAPAGPPLLLALVSTRRGAEYLLAVLETVGGPKAVMSLLELPGGADLLVNVLRTRTGPDVVLLLLKSREGTALLLRIVGSPGGVRLLLTLLHSDPGAAVLVNILAAPLGPSLLLNIVSTPGAAEAVLDLVRQPQGLQALLRFVVSGRRPADDPANGVAMLARLLSDVAGVTSLENFVHAGVPGLAVLLHLSSTEVGTAALNRIVAREAGLDLLLQFSRTAEGVQVLHQLLRFRPETAAVGLRPAVDLQSGLHATSVGSGGFRLEPGAPALPALPALPAPPAAAIHSPGVAAPAALIPALSPPLVDHTGAWDPAAHGEGAALGAPRRLAVGYADSAPPEGVGAPIFVQDGFAAAPTQGGTPASPVFPQFLLPYDAAYPTPRRRLGVLRTAHAADAATGGAAGAPAAVGDYILYELVGRDAGVAALLNLARRPAGLRALLEVTRDAAGMQILANLALLDPPQGTALLYRLSASDEGTRVLLLFLHRVSGRDALMKLSSEPAGLRVLHALAARQAGLELLLRLGSKDQGTQFLDALISQPGGFEVLYKLVVDASPGPAEARAVAIAERGVGSVGGGLAGVAGDFVAGAGADFGVASAAVGGPAPGVAALNNLLAQPAGLPALFHLVTAHPLLGVPALNQLLAHPGGLAALHRLSVERDGAELLARLVERPAGRRVLFLITARADGVAALANLLSRSAGFDALFALAGDRAGIEALLLLAADPAGLEALFDLSRTREGCAALYAIVFEPAGVRVLLELARQPNGAEGLRLFLEQHHAVRLMHALARLPRGIALLHQLVRSPERVELLVRLASAPAGCDFLLTVVNAPGGVDLLLRLLQVPGAADLLNQLLVLQNGYDSLVRLLTTPVTFRFLREFVLGARADLVLAKILAPAIYLKGSEAAAAAAAGAANDGAGGLFTPLGPCPAGAPPAIDILAGTLANPRVVDLLIHLLDEGYQEAASLLTRALELAADASCELPAIAIPVTPVPGTLFVNNAKTPLFAKDPFELVVIVALNLLDLPRVTLRLQSFTRATFAVDLDLFELRVRAIEPLAIDFGSCSADQRQTETLVMTLITNLSSARLLRDAHVELLANDGNTRVQVRPL